MADRCDQCEVATTQSVGCQAPADGGTTQIACACCWTVALERADQPAVQIGTLAWSKQQVSSGHATPDKGSGTNPSLAAAAPAHRALARAMGVRPPLYLLNHSYLI